MQGFEEDAGAGVEAGVPEDGDPPEPPHAGSEGGEEEGREAPRRARAAHAQLAGSAGWGAA